MWGCGLHVFIDQPSDHFTYAGVYFIYLSTFTLVLDVCMYVAFLYVSLFFPFGWEVYV